MQGRSKQLLEEDFERESLKDRIYLVDLENEERLWDEIIRDESQAEIIIGKPIKRKRRSNGQYIRHNHRRV